MRVVRRLAEEVSLTFETIRSVTLSQATSLADCDHPIYPVLILVLVRPSLPHPNPTSLSVSRTARLHHSRDGRPTLHRHAQRQERFPRQRGRTRAVAGSRS